VTKIMGELGWSREERRDGCLERWAEWIWTGRTVKEPGEENGSIFMVPFPDKNPTTTYISVSGKEYILKRIYFISYD
jgi:hypothetical protein